MSVILTLNMPVPFQLMLQLLLFQNKSQNLQFNEYLPCSVSLYFSDVGKQIGMIVSGLKTPLFRKDIPKLYYLSIYILKTIKQNNNDRSLAEVDYHNYL